MRIPVLLVFLIPFQGCTLLGLALDEQLGVKNKHNQKGGTLSELGTQADIALIKSAVAGESLSSSKKTKTCKDLIGAKKEKCIKKVNLLNESINKHIKQ